VIMANPPSGVSLCQSGPWAVISAQFRNVEMQCPCEGCTAVRTLALTLLDPLGNLDLQEIQVYASSVSAAEVRAAVLRARSSALRT
jgi:hypothetical protein